mmetsp:Transcript_15547/g.40185  ORF Transcript_15547/g.40185 Transcript_15547/m.40185 type:complete len:130 (+) Transcript_15547:412-801(+)
MKSKIMNITLSGARRGLRIPVRKLDWGRATQLHQKNQMDHALLPRLPVHNPRGSHLNASYFRIWEVTVHFFAFFVFSSWAIRASHATTICTTLANCLNAQMGEHMKKSARTAGMPPSMAMGGPSNQASM